MYYLLIYQCIFASMYLPIYFIFEEHFKVYRKKWSDCRDFSYTFCLYECLISPLLSVTLNKAVHIYNQGILLIHLLLTNKCLNLLIK